MLCYKPLNDVIDWYDVEVDTTSRQLIFSSSSSSSSFIYNEKKMSLTLNGLFKGDSLKVTLRNKDLNEFRLINRGFNWKNEYPYNR